MDDSVSKIAAHHVMIDMYECKETRLYQDDALLTTLPSLFSLHGLAVLECRLTEIDARHKVFVLLLADGHLLVHIYGMLGYVAADLFLCRANADYDKLTKALRGLFRPIKYRSTYIKRGEFTNPTDIKPRVKTRTAPLRKIRSTGAKVVRKIFARREENTTTD